MAIDEFYKALDSQQLLPRAEHLLRRVPLIDGHNDFPFMIRGLYSNTLEEGSLEQFPIGQTDIARMRRGMLGGQFWSAYVPCPKQPDSASDEPYLECLLQTLQQIDVIHQMTDQYPKTFAFAQSATDVWRAFNSGRIASLIGIEGLHQIANSPSVLRMLHRLGVRYATLTHAKNNQYCDSAVDGPASSSRPEPDRQANDQRNEPRWNTAVANAAVDTRIIDLSHTSAYAQNDVLEISKSPVIFSHSACATLVPHPRNVTDDTLQKLKRNGGVLMVCFLRELVDPSGGHKASCSQVADHIIYAAEQMGFDHVGIGSDFDGMLQGPAGLDDVSALPQLVVELLQKGVAESDVEKVVGLNILRVLKEVGDVAFKEQTTRATTPMTEDIPPMWTAEQKEILHLQGAKRGLGQGNVVASKHRYDQC
ncbi:renal dipeptidase family [Aspergillus heterothallicus]